MRLSYWQQGELVSFINREPIGIFVPFCRQERVKKEVKSIKPWRMELVRSCGR